MTAEHLLNKLTVEFENSHTSTSLSFSVFLDAQIANDSEPNFSHFSPQFHSLLENSQFIQYADSNSFPGISIARFLGN